MWTQVVHARIVFLYNRKADKHGRSNERCISLLSEFGSIPKFEMELNVQIGGRNVVLEMVQGVWIKHFL